MADTESVTQRLGQRETNGEGDSLGFRILNLARPFQYLDCRADNTKSKCELSIK